MTWHLKNRDLEQKLLALDHNFLTNLDIFFDMFRADARFNKNSGAICIREKFEVPISTTGHSTLHLEVDPNDLVEILEYNPNTWNEYPKVTPPQLQPMKIEFIKRIDGIVTQVREFGVFNKTFWFIPAVDSGLSNYHFKGMPVRLLNDFSNLRFRSWED